MSEIFLAIFTIILYSKTCLGCGRSIIVEQETLISPTEILDYVRLLGLSVTLTSGGSFKPGGVDMMTFNGESQALCQSFSKSYDLHRDACVFMDVLARTEKNLGVTLFN